MTGKQYVVGKDHTITGARVFKPPELRLLYKHMADTAITRNTRGLLTKKLVHLGKSLIFAFGP